MWTDIRKSYFCLSGRHWNTSFSGSLGDGERVHAFLCFVCSFILLSFAIFAPPLSVFLSVYLPRWIFPGRLWSPWWRAQGLWCDPHSYILSSVDLHTKAPPPPPRRALLHRECLSHPQWPLPAGSCVRSQGVESGRVWKVSLRGGGDLCLLSTLTLFRQREPMRTFGMSGA